MVGLHHFPRAFIPIGEQQAAAGHGFQRHAREAGLEGRGEKTEIMLAVKPAHFILPRHGANVHLPAQAARLYLAPQQRQVRRGLRLADDEQLGGHAAPAQFIHQQDSIQAALLLFDARRQDDLQRGVDSRRGFEREARDIQPRGDDRGVTHEPSLRAGVLERGRAVEEHAHAFGPLPIWPNAPTAHQPGARFNQALKPGLEPRLARVLVEVQPAFLQP